MQNELNWKHAEDGGFPMKLVEKGLDFKGKTALFFYASVTIAVVSMVWVIMLSVRIMQLSRTDPSIPSYYVTIAIVCIAVSMISLHHFYKVFADRKAYFKQIDILDGNVSFVEITREGRKEWQEKLRKFDGISLRHYTHRGRESWYIAIVHSDNTKSFPVFSPGEADCGASEETKRQLLARYGSQFSQFKLATIYEKTAEKKEEQT
ncbi:MAG: hypothetical protein KKB51_22570 [Candidatus Riflebacteria bacterium]|nr:hypothetical protein [Candidatus Riflebacteria bacterium]